MSGTSARTLQLLSLLQTHRHWPGGELAARLEVSQRTLRRDVERLRDLGYPVEATPGAHGGYQLGAGASLPPLTVDEDEAIALVMALGAHAAAVSGPLADASLAALSKVTQVLPARLRRRAEALRTATVAAPFSGGAAGRRRGPRGRRPHDPRPRAAAVRVPRGRRHRDPAARRAAPAS
ncbi:MAG: HTH domain-containing protein [Aeromicrobium erythreum]